MINPLWLSVQNLDFLAMVDSLQNIIDTPTDYKVYMKVPYANPMIIFAFLPLIGTILGCLVCIFVCSGVCCCSAASRYRNKNKKLQKESHQILIKYGIDAKGALPSNIVADSTQISSEERAIIIYKIEKQKPDLEKVNKKAKCAKWCWWAWLLAAILYILSIIFVICGISFFGGMPKSFIGVANQQVKVVTDLLESMADVGDNALKAVYGTNEKVFTELIKNESSFNTTLASFRTNAKLMHSLNDLKSNLTLLDQKLTQWIASILFFPPSSSSFSYAATGQAAFNRLLDGFGNMKTLMDSLNSSVSFIKTLGPNVPSSLTSNFNSIPQIPDISVSGDPKLILDDLMKGRSLTKWKFADTISKKFIPASMKAFVDILIPRDADGNLKTSSQTLFSAAGTSSNNILDVVQDPITGLVDKIADLLQKVYDSDYLLSLLALKTISFSELSDQLGTPKSATCSYLWCGLVNITNITENFGTIPILSLFKTDSLEELLQKPVPIVYSMCLIIPFLILISTALCMGYKKTCCSTCSICCCPFCNCVIAILGILLMLFSLFSSGILTPLTNTLRSDATNLFDAGIKIGQNLKLIKHAVKYDLPNVPMLNMVPSTLTIDIGPMKDILSSVNINITVKELIPPLPETPATGVIGQLLELIGVNSFGQLFNKISTWATAQLNTINLNISLANSDLNKLFSKDQEGILNLIKIGNNTLQQFINNTIDQALKIILDDHFSIIKLIFDVPSMSGKINGYNQVDMKSKIKEISGFNLDDISDVSTTSNFSNKLQEAFCKASMIPDGTRSSIAVVSGLFKQLSDNYEPACSAAINGNAFTNPTPPASSSTQVGTTIAIEIYEAIFVNLWVEFLADQGELLSKLPNTLTTAADVSAATTQYIENAIFGSSGDIPQDSIVSFINNIATATFSSKTINDYATRYATCPDDNQVTNSNAVTKNDAPFTNLINVPAEFIVNMVQRKVISHSVTRPVTNPTLAADIADFNLYKGLGVLFQVHCQYVNQLITAAKSLETTPSSVPLNTAVTHAATFTDAIIKIRVLKKSLIDLNGQIGTKALDASASASTCTATPVAPGPNLDSFLTKFVDDVIIVVKSIFLNIVETVTDGSKFGLLFEVFADVKIFEKIQDFVMNIIDKVLHLLCSSASPLNSSILGMAPQLVADAAQATLGWFDAFSFACYLSFLFLFFGPMCMAFSYNYNRIYSYELKMSKKYGFKFEFGKEVGNKRGKKSQSQIIVANNDSLFELAKKQPPQFNNSQYI
ncbi:Conserved_hypothetical protein [Hexamita inflata]|uniref:Plasma membrane fusion protein PRM1 n=1 Tax=Hexamita inflata TaxID=28002 RepID=A0ABP1KIX3_9EUKA